MNDLKQWQHAVQIMRYSNAYENVYRGKSCVKEVVMLMVGRTKKGV